MCKRQDVIWKENKKIRSGGSIPSTSRAITVELLSTWLLHLSEGGTTSSCYGRRRHNQHSHKEPIHMGWHPKRINFLEKFDVEKTTIEYPEDHNRSSNKRQNIYRNVFVKLKMN